MKRFLIPFLAALALPTFVNANVDPKIAEICMKAVDFQGCVKAMGGETTDPVRTTIISNKQNDLLLEIKKLPSRIENTSLRDYTSRTLSFEDAFAVSSPEEVGENLYFNAKNISLALDILYETWNRNNNVVTYNGSWLPDKNLKTKRDLDRIFGGNTIEIKCNKRFFGLLGGGTKRVGESLLNPVAKVIAHASSQVKTADDKIIFPSQNEPSFITSTAPFFCPGDPNAPVEVKKTKAKDKPKQSVKINCDSPVWKNKPRCNMD